MFHLDSCYASHFTLWQSKKQKTWATTQDLHKIVGATTLQAVGYTTNDGKEETNCL